MPGQTHGVGQGKLFELGQIQNYLVSVNFISSVVLAGIEENFPQKQFLEKKYE